MRSPRLAWAAAAVLAFVAMGCGGTNPPCETDVTTVEAAREAARSAEEKLEAIESRRVELEDELAAQEERRAELERRKAELEGSGKKTP